MSRTRITVPQRSWLREKEAGDGFPLALRWAKHRFSLCVMYFRKAPGHSLPSLLFFLLYCFVSRWIALLAAIEVFQISISVCVMIDARSVFGPIILQPVYKKNTVSACDLLSKILRKIFRRFYIECGTIRTSMWYWEFPLVTCRGSSTAFVPFQIANNGSITSTK